MLTSLRLTRFRAFENLTVDGLTRVNLFVGANNAGKTCVLEAAEILVGGAEPQLLQRSLARRAGTIGKLFDHVDPRQLFRGRSFRIGSSFRIDAQDSLRGDQFAACDFHLVPPGAAFSAELTISRNPDPLGVSSINISLAPVEGVPAMRTVDYLDDDDLPRFVSTADPTYRLSWLWDHIVLSPEEEKVIRALQIIEPGIERIAALSKAAGNETGNFVVKIRGDDDRVPLGSMGDGVKRLLVLAVNLVSSEGSHFFVDEIDTGLHYSVMVKMWRLMVETARALNVQVFATTHSLDCVRALAALSESTPAALEDVSIHRIERGRDASIRYSLDEARIAVEHEMEIR